MGKDYTELRDDHIEWIGHQHLFFVASAPNGPGGRVNLSPKGYDTFRVLSPNSIAYLDLTGSGIETAAHLAENGRITVMFCAYEGKPKILRMYGKGTYNRLGDPGFDELLQNFTDHPGARGIVTVEVDLVRSSCGYSIPFMDYVGERETLHEWAERKGDDGVEQYWTDRNAQSIDGLPGLD